MTAQQMLISYLSTKNAIYHRDKVFLKDETHQVTFGEFEARTNALARGMMAQGVKAGDRVVVMNHNSREF